MEHKKHILRFRAADRDIFDAIVNGKKKVETRAATQRYIGMHVGDTVVLICGTKKASKTVSAAKIYKSIGALLKKYKPQHIHPAYKTTKEITDMFYSFSGYRETIKKSGIIALELK